MTGEAREPTPAIETLVAECVESIDREGHAAVDRVCAEYPELAGELRERLQKLARLGMLERPSAAGQALPSRIGPYRVKRVLGQGGMGVVYLAEQEGDVQRQVAVKVVRAGMDSADIVGRFKAERQTLALLNHPNIAKVFDAGTNDDGRPYFVMEYVPGLPITAYCVQHRLGTEERIRLLVQVCRGVQHAHQKGIIHRDLKPSNLLVTDDDGVAVPKIIDFGVAKATREAVELGTLYTMPGQLVGTLEYMSPEQANTSGLDVDTRSDVYGLGVVLYQLLSGRLPLEVGELGDANLPTLIAALTERDPPAPSARVPRTDSALRRRLSGELDWITLRALERDRERRYPTVRLLAEDLVAFLERRPVAAGPPSLAYRARKFVGRNRAAVTAAVLVLTTLVAGLVTSASYYWRSHRAHGQTQVFYRTARQAIDELLVRIADNRLYDEPGLQGLRRDLLEEALEFYQGLLDLRGDDSRLRLELADAHIRVSDIQRRLGRLDDVERHAREAIVLLEKLRRELGGESAHATSLGKARLTLAAAQRVTGREVEAIASTEQAIELFEKSGQVDDPAIAAHLAAGFNNLGLMLRSRDPGRACEAMARGVAILEKNASRDSAEGRWQLAGVRSSYAEFLGELGKVDEAEKEQRRALAELERLVRDHPERDRYKATLCAVRMGLADILVMRGDPVTAGDLHASVIDTWERLVSRFPRTTSYRSALAAAYAAHGRQLMDHDAGRAAARYESAIDEYERLVRDVPDRPGYRLRLARSVGNVASMRVRAGQLERVDAPLARGIELLEQLRQELPEEPEVFRHLATVYSLRSLRRVGDDAGAALEDQRTACVHARRAVALTPRIPRAHDSLATSLQLLARLELAAGNGRSAAKQLVEAREHAEAALRIHPDHQGYVRTRLTVARSIATTHAALGEFGEAMEAAQLFVDLAGPIGHARTVAASVALDVAAGLGGNARKDALGRARDWLQQAALSVPRSGIAAPIDDHAGALEKLARLCGTAERETTLGEALRLRIRAHYTAGSPGDAAAVVRTALALAECKAEARDEAGLAKLARHVGRVRRAPAAKLAAARIYARAAALAGAEPGRVEPLRAAARKHYEAAIEQGAEPPAKGAAPFLEAVLEGR